MNGRPKRNVLKPKRYRSDDGNQQTPKNPKKPKKPKKPTQPKTESKKTSDIESNTFQIKLTDLNDCLEVIFMHLDVGNLLNIAHTNTELKPDADLVFASKYRNTRFHFSRLTHHRNIKMIDDDEIKTISIHDLKSFLRLLRCYGHFISDLNFEYRVSFRTTPPTKELHYINQYCSDSLKKIKFSNILSSVFDQTMKQPFKKIETVEFCQCNLGKMSELNTWFPAMRSLTLNQSRLISRSSIEKRFPQLQELNVLEMFSINYLTPDNVMTVFELNRQLRRITLDRPSSDRILTIASQLPLLQELTISDYSQHFSSSNTIHFKSVRKLKINIIHRSNMEQSSINLLFDHLEFVHMNNTGCRGITDETVEFFKKHPSITKLTLIASNTASNKDHTIRILAALPHLNEFSMFKAIFSVEEISNICTKFKSLIRFCFQFSSADEHEIVSRLKIRLHDEWQVTIKPQLHAELKRRT